MISVIFVHDWVRVGMFVLIGKVCEHLSIVDWKRCCLILIKIFLLVWQKMDFVLFFENKLGLHEVSGG